MHGCRERLEQYLKENRVVFEAQRHPVAYTAQEVAASEHVPGNQLAKVVIAQADERTVMLVVPAPYRVDFMRVSQAVGAADVRLAWEDEFAPLFPDCELGAMPPFGNLYGVPVYVDRALTQDETIVFEAGSHTETMAVRYRDYERLVRPTVAEFTQHV